MKKYILALDQGTSSSRALLFDKECRITGMEQQEFSQYYPNPGWVEHSPDEIWQSQIDVAKKLIAKLNIKSSEIAAIGITNQRETTLVWDKNSGKPVYNALVWQDKRTSDYCKLLKAQGLESFFKQHTGLVIDSYFSASKLRWLIQNVPDARKKMLDNQLKFGTVDTWLIWQLTNGKVHATDTTNASRTLLYNIVQNKWDADLIKLFSAHENMLPEVKSSSEIFGYTHKDIFDGVEIPIAGVIGDQQAALFGQTCFEPGMAKNTYGTGCFMLMNTGDKMVPSPSGLLTTIAWTLDGKTEYALEGSVFTTGAAIKWLRDSLHLINDASETEHIAQSLPSCEGVYLVPAFAGLGAPHWDMDARGAIYGLTQGSTPAHIIRATLESIAYQTKDVLGAMTKDSGITLKSLNVDGGASVNNFLMQFQADVLNTPVIRPTNIETTAAGAAFMAGLAVGFWDKNYLLNQHTIDRKYEPQISELMRDELCKGWNKAVIRTLK